MTKRTVRLDQVRSDGDTQFRKKIDQKNINYYAECMEDGDVFPPIEVVFDGSEYWLWNGFHRYHAYKKIGVDVVEVDYRPGTQEDAQDLALGANSDHGFGLTKADRKNKVQWALSQERYKDYNNVQLAKLCKVSDTFVAAERNPAVRQKQEQNRLTHYQNKLESSSTEGNQSSSTDLGSTEIEPKPSILDGSEPSAEELMANDLAMQADLELVNQFLESDDKLAELYAEVKKLNHMLAQKESRIASLMREKSECIKLCHKLQKENDKLKGKK